MSVTVTHDPDDPRGCIECPLFFGVPRDGVCRGLGGMTLNFAGRIGEGRVCFEPDPDCPLRNGGVNVRGPETVPADHHEPARGDAVPVEAWSAGYAAAIGDVRRALNGEPQGPMPPESSTVIDRVEALRRTWHTVATQRDEAMGTVAAIATALGMDPGALDGAVVERVETLRDVVGMHVRVHARIAASLGMTAQPVERVADAVEALRREVSEATREGERRIDALDAELRQHEDGAAEVRAALGATDDETTLDAARRVRAERDAAECPRDAARDVLRDETDTLRLYLARALREVDPKLRRNIEADLRSEGLTPPGVLVSAEDAAVVCRLISAAIDVEAVKGGSMRVLHRAIVDWDAAGRPLASEETR